MRRNETITERLKRGVVESGRTQRAIAAEAGISHIVLNRFLKQSGGLSMNGIDSLAQVLGLHLMPMTSRTKKSKATKGR